MTERFAVFKFVEVALVISAVPMVDDALLKFWKVDEAVEMRPLVYVFNCVHVLALVVETRSERTAFRARALVKY